MNSTRATGRDGRPLVDTKMAAYSLGMKPGSFRKWAVRHGITPTAYQPNGKRGQQRGLWDLADISDTLAKKLSTAA